MRKVIAAFVAVVALAGATTAAACPGGQPDGTGWTHHYSGWSRLSPTSGTVQATIQPTSLVFVGPTTTDDDESVWVMAVHHNFDVYVQLGWRYLDYGFQYTGGRYFVEWIVGGQRYDSYSGVVPLGSHTYKMVQSGTNTFMYIDGAANGYVTMDSPTITQFQIYQEANTYTPTNSGCMTAATSFSGTSFSLSVATPQANAPYVLSNTSQTSFNASGPSGGFSAVAAMQTASPVSTKKPIVVPWPPHG